MEFSIDHTILHGFCSWCCGCPSIIPCLPPVYTSLTSKCQHLNFFAWSLPLASRATFLAHWTGKESPVLGASTPRPSINNWFYLVYQFSFKEIHLPCPIGSCIVYTGSKVFPLDSSFCYYGVGLLYHPHFKNWLFLILSLSYTPPCISWDYLLKTTLDE